MGQDEALRAVVAHHMPGLDEPIAVVEQRLAAGVPPGVGIVACMCIRKWEQMLKSI